MTEPKNLRLPHALIDRAYVCASGKKRGLESWMEEATRTRTETTPVEACTRRNSKPYAVAFDCSPAEARARIEARANEEIEAAAEMSRTMAIFDYTNTIGVSMEEAERHFDNRVAERRKQLESKEEK
jgi:Tfp pilus assembly protein PilP